MLSGPWTTPTRTLKRQPFRKIGEGMCFDTTDYDIARSAKCNSSPELRAFGGRNRPQTELSTSGRL